VSRKLSPLVGLLLILGSGVLQFSVSEYTGKNSAYMIGGLTGTALILLLVLAAILAFTPARKTVDMMLLGGVVFMGVAVWQSLAMLSADREQRSLAQNFTDGMDNLIAQREALVAPQGGAVVRAQNEAVVTPQTVPGNDARSLLKQFMDLASERQLRAAKAMEVARLDVALAPSTMLDPVQAAAARKRVATLRQANAMICREGVASISDFEKTLENSSDPESAEMLAGFRKTKQDGINRANAWCEVEDKLAGAVDRLLEITMGNAHRISVNSDGQMIFEDEATLLIYNQSFAKFTELAQQEERMEQENVALMKSNRNKMAKLAHIEERP
jgi:hypothetical protein